MRNINRTLKDSEGRASVELARVQRRSTHVAELLRKVEYYQYWAGKSLSGRKSLSIDVTNICQANASEK